MRGEEPQVLLLTGDTRVREVGDGLIIERRGALQLGIGAAVVGIGAAFLAARELAGERAPAGLLDWAGWLLVALGLVNLGIGALRGLASPLHLDGSRRLLIRGDLRVPFEQLGPPQIVETAIAGQVAVALTIAAPTGPLRLIEGQLARERGRVQAVAKRVATLLDAGAPRRASTVVGSGRGFKVALLLSLGLVWAGSAWWLAPGVVWTWPGGSFGARMWPLGLWIAALGLLELGGGRVFDALVGPWTRRRGLLFALWTGSYLLVNAVRIGP